VVIDTESLVILFQCTEFAQKREVFSGILKIISASCIHECEDIKENLLSVLRNQKYQREVIHPQSNVEQCIRVDQKDNVSDRVLNGSGYALCSEVHCQGSPSRKKG